MFDTLKNEVLQINEDLCRFFTDADKLPGSDNHSFTNWGNTCQTIREQVDQGVLRVAIVGSIKSGKSTFANALLKGDHLKRGAGVVTSIVTKVQRGPHLTATLFFKSWDEVNSDIGQALLLFPSFSTDADPDLFDIRRVNDRLKLQRVIEELGPELLIKDGGLNANAVLLSCYVKGYDRVKNMVSTENRISIYEKSHFKDHRVFVGDDALSVYLKDVQLEIDSDGLAENIEIADCQGSDSTNPLHLSMVQDYLTLTHLIVYVVSSRTGLRQADIKFLSMIRKMGILDNTLFVINTDFSEHESLDEMTSLVERVKQELSVLYPDPKVFSFSALFNLLGAVPDQIAKKDQLRLAQWCEERAAIEWSDRETERFNRIFYGTLTEERSNLLLKNHLERLAVISMGFDNWIRLNRDILSGDVQGAEAILGKMKSHQQQIEQVKALISSTLTGAEIKEKKKLKMDIDQFFSDRQGDLVGETLRFIRNYTVPYDTYKDRLSASGFSHTLYLVFQEFRQALDLYMAEHVNPGIIRFVKEMEADIVAHFRSAVDPYHVMIRDVLSGYDGVVEGSGTSFGPAVSEVGDPPDLESIKTLLNLSFPPVAASMRYSAKIKTDAVLHLGLYTFTGFLRKVFKRKGDRSGRNDRILALKDGVRGIKRETEKAVVFHFKSYRENIKFQYIIKLVDAVSHAVFESMVSRFQIYATDLTYLIELLDREESEKENAMAILEDMSRSAGQLDERIGLAREKISETVYRKIELTCDRKEGRSKWEVAGPGLSRWQMKRGGLAKP